MHAPGERREEATHSTSVLVGKIQSYRLGRLVLWIVGGTGTEVRRANPSSMGNGPS